GKPKATPAIAVVRISVSLMVAPLPEGRRLRLVSENSGLARGSSSVRIEESGPVSRVLGGCVFPRHSARAVSAGEPLASQCLPPWAQSQTRKGQDAETERS